ncbi:hypothetical protein NFI96_032880 [Prochilodus magdalenae]|nr:hypothetical protein NFI96_032880 [Prochilodus magdalenae]
MTLLLSCCFLPVSAQLQCDRPIIRTTVGETFNVACTYNSQYRFSKKYWCLGESRGTCEILMDTDGFTKAELKNRAWITDAVYRGLHVLMTGLQLRDSGVYWVGIDKIYSDIMFKIHVEVKEEAVSRPKVWPVGSPLLTCQGQSLTLRCRSDRGSNVQYSWYRKAHPEAVLLQSTSDLPLHCASLTKDGQFVCSARNTVSTEHSNAVFIQVLQPGHEDCVYSLTSEGFEIYDCKTTTTPQTSTTMTTVEVFSSTLGTQTQTRGYENQSLCGNQTWTEDVLFRSWSGVPLWYDIIRWTLFAIMMVTTGLVHVCKQSKASGHRVTHKHQKHT